MIREDRVETCPDCQAPREREWIVRDMDARATAPTGFRVERRRGGTKRVAAPTKWTTLCLCDL